MNALFGRVIKVFLALVQADDAVGQNDGDGAYGRDCHAGNGITVCGHIGSYPGDPDFSHLTGVW